MTCFLDWTFFSMLCFDQSQLYFSLSMADQPNESKNEIESAFYPSFLPSFLLSFPLSFLPSFFQSSYPAIQLSCTDQ